MRNSKAKEDRSKIDPVGPAETSLSPRGGAKHGRLKEVIIAELRKAGRKGMTINELADKIEVFKPRVSAWFSGTGKRTPEVCKIGVAQWRYVGSPSGRKTSP